MGTSALRVDAPSPPAFSLAVVSGKGGAGKSVISASLGRLFGRRGPTLLVDADLGVGNAHILQDVSGETSLVDVVDGRARVADIRLPCSAGLELVGGGSGVPRMGELGAEDVYRIARGIEEIEREYRYLIADAAAGVSDQTVALAAACDAVLIVTTPDLTAMTDAYAFEKVLKRRDPGARSFLLVNRAADEQEAESVACRLQNVSRRFVGRAPTWIGWLPDDRAIARSVNRRSPVVDCDPSSPVAGALRGVAARLQYELERQRPSGMGRRLRATFGA